MDMLRILLSQLEARRELEAQFACLPADPLGAFSNPFKHKDDIVHLQDQPNAKTLFDRLCRRLERRSAWLKMHASSTTACLFFIHVVMHTTPFVTDCCQGL